MATGKETVAAKKPVTRARIKIDLPGEPEQDVELDPEEMVTATVPKAFNLTLDAGHTIRINAGTQEMPRSHAEHWYALAHGVTVKSK